MHSMQLIALYIYNSTMELCSLNPQHLHHFLTLSDFYNLSLTLSTDSNLAKREEPMNKTFHSITPTYLLKQHPYSIWLPKDNNNGSKEAQITNLNEFEQHERIYSTENLILRWRQRKLCRREEPQIESEYPAIKHEKCENWIWISNPRATKTTYPSSKHHKNPKLTNLNIKLETKHTLLEQYRSNLLL